MRVRDWRRALGDAIEPIVRDLRRSYAITGAEVVDGTSWNGILRGIGPGGTFCIKVFNEQTSGLSRGMRDLNTVGQAIECLSDHGFHRVIPPLKTKDGELCVRCGGYWAMVFPWIPDLGAYLWPTTGAHVDRAAALLADLHAAGRAVVEVLPSLLTREFPPAYTPAAWAANHDRMWDLAELNVKVRSGPGAVLTLLRAHRINSERLMSDHPDFFTLSDGESTLLHGDYAPENIAFASTPRELVYDFDLVHGGVPEVDLAYAGLSFSGPRWMMGPRDWNACRRFIRAYVDRQHQVGSASLCASRLVVAFDWIVHKWMSLSFKPGQVEARTQLLHDVRRHAARVAEMRPV